MKTLVALSLLLLQVNSGFTQQVVVANNRQNIVYSGVQNSLSALAAGFPCQSVVLTTDNGKIEKSGCSFIYQPTRTGATKIKVWVREGQKLKLIDSVMYRSKPLPLPITFIGNNRGGYINLNVLIAQGGVRGYIPELNVDAPINIISYTVTATRATTFLFKNENIGAIYNEALLKKLSLLKAGDSFLVSNIICEGLESKKVNPGPMEFYIK